MHSLSIFGARVKTVALAASLVCFAQAGTTLAEPRKAPIQITADLSDASRKLYHAEVDLPVSAGPVTLTTPQWIPGTHMPAGPAQDITGVVFTANGKPLTWRRDDVDLYQFHLTIPPGVATLHVHLDCIVTERISQKLAVLEWEKLLLYPANIPVAEIPIQPSLIVPAGWGIGTALTPMGSGAYPVPAAGAVTRFAATNVEQLEDTPVLVGQYFHEFPLAPEISPKHYLDVVSDAPGDSNLSAPFLAEIANLVREADKMYASHHYNHYHFLLTVSDLAGFEGLEHGQSSDNGVGAKDLSDPGRQVAVADLLPHEFTHSWNGKYRRPVGLYQPDFAKPQQGALLWVYEGMTQYLGEVLAARSGLRSQLQYREVLAFFAALLDYTPGRNWRTTEDTAVAASMLRDEGPVWSNWRRRQDYYYEGELLWLDVDTLIRKTTNNQKSLNDFVTIFLAKGGNTGPLIVPYTFDELVACLNQVMPYDWAAFLRDRVGKINARADLAGIEQGGYQLVYRDQPSDSEKSIFEVFGKYVGNVDAWFSVGLRANNDGTIVDVRWNSPADKARLTPGSKILGVNGQIFGGDLLIAAIREAKGKTDPIHLIVQSDSFLTAVDIDYHDGERYPALERIAGTPAYLDDITKPLVSSPPIPAETRNKD
jgi:predicted metalloprotease with PDZ domain